MKRSLLNITYKDRKTSGLDMDKSRNQQCENIEMVLGRAHQPPKKKPMDIACLHLENIRQEKTKRETSPTVERRPGQILERHDLAEDGTRQANMDTMRGHHPTTGRNGCPVMMIMGLQYYTHNFVYFSCAYLCNRIKYFVIVMMT